MEIRKTNRCFDGAYEIVEATESENGEMTVKIIEKGFCK